MKIPGYCEKCHRARRVTVTGSALARGGTPTGICDPCATPTCEHGNCAKPARHRVARTVDRRLYPTGQLLCDWHEDHAADLGIRSSVLR
ncbi:MAG TPA: hypothetical protein VMW08_00720 [Acidimicrobiales bacterium]|nr:hypothetical protein [Acidimicrobiales bacterium]